MNEKDMVKRCMEYIEGKAEPKTAEELMKSRYTAYTIGNIDYIIDTHDPSTSKDISKEETEEWAKSSEWLGLEIIATEAGSTSDDKGVVEFPLYNLYFQPCRLHICSSLTPLQFQVFPSPLESPCIFFQLTSLLPPNVFHIITQIFPGIPIWRKFLKRLNM